MASPKRILGTLVVLVVGGYLAFEAGIFTSMRESREMATSFCNKVTAGLPVNTALALARENVAATRLHVEVDEMFISFRGGCHCRVTFKGGKAFPHAVICGH
jgi:hypothetical protein